MSAQPAPGVSVLDAAPPESGPNGVRFTLGRRARPSRFGIWTYEDPRGTWWYTQTGWVPVTVGSGGSDAGIRPPAPPNGARVPFFDVVDGVWTSRDPQSPWFYLLGVWTRFDQLDAWVRKHSDHPTKPSQASVAAGVASKMPPGATPATTTPGAEAGNLGLWPLVWLARPNDRRKLAQLIEPLERLLLFFIWNRRGIEHALGHTVIFPVQGVSAPWTLPSAESPKPGTGVLPGRVPDWMDDPKVAHAKNALALIAAARSRACALLDAPRPPRGAWAVLARGHRLLVANRVWTAARSAPDGSPALWLASEGLWALRQVVYPKYPAKGKSVFGPLRRSDVALRSPVSRADFQAAKYFLAYQAGAPERWLQWSPGCSESAKATCASCAGGKSATASIRSLCPGACPCAAGAETSKCVGCASTKSIQPPPSKAPPQAASMLGSTRPGEPRGPDSRGSLLGADSCERPGGCGNRSTSGFPLAHDAHVRARP